MARIDTINKSFFFGILVFATHNCLLPPKALT